VLNNSEVFDITLAAFLASFVTLCSGVGPFGYILGMILIMLIIIAVNIIYPAESLPPDDFERTLIVIAYMLMGILAGFVLWALSKLGSWGRLDTKKHKG
jgi:hypothetical protein